MMRNIQTSKQSFIGRHGDNFPDFRASRPSLLEKDSSLDLGTVAGWVTAIATLLTATGGLIVVVRTIIPAKKQIEETNNQVQEVHTIVNQQRTDMQRYTRVLENFITAQGMQLPEDQSKLDLE
jgi:hypothetical protein